MAFDIARLSLRPVSPASAISVLATTTTTATATTTAPTMAALIKEYILLETLLTVSPSV